MFSVSTVKTSDCPQTWAGLYFVPSVLPRDQKSCILCMGESDRRGRAGFSASRECEPNHLPHAHQLIAGEHTRGPREPQSWEHTRGPREPQSHSAGKDFRSRKITLQSPGWEMKETEEGTHRGEEFAEGECLQRGGISRGGPLQRRGISRGGHLQRRSISRSGDTDTPPLHSLVLADTAVPPVEGASAQEGPLQKRVLNFS